MLNAEKYQERIKELDYRFALCDGELKHCRDIRCDRCMFDEPNTATHCLVNKTKWLLEEYKEPVLSSKEKAYLKSVIEPLNIKVRYAKKYKCSKCDGSNETYFIFVRAEDPVLKDKDFPYEFMNFAVTEDMPFNGMKLYKEYAGEELEL